MDETDRNPNNPDNVILVYTGYSVDGEWYCPAKNDCTWNRKHVWPQSLLGSSADNNTANIASDLHNLKPADSGENSSGGYKYFDNITTTLSYPPRAEVKGDLARILFYMTVIYDYLELMNGIPTTYQMTMLDILIEWHEQDEVKNATDYILDINGEEIKITQTSYQHTSEGIFLVKVKSVAKGFIDSPYSEVIEIVIDYTLTTPMNLSITESVLTWDAIEGFNSYEVLINQTTVPATTNALSLDAYLPNVLLIRVKAIYNSGSSAYSEQLIYADEADLLSETKYQISNQSNFELVILETDTFLNIADNEDQSLSSAHFTYVSQQLKLTNPFIKGLDVGTYTLRVLTESGYHSIELQVINTTNPYIITTNQIYTDFNDDIEILYELFNGSIEAVSGNNITSSDYTINQNKLTIDINYVKDIFDSEPERTTLILSYTLQKDQDLTIGYLFIRKAE